MNYISVIPQTRVYTYAYLGPQEKICDNGQVVGKQAITLLADSNFQV